MYFGTRRGVRAESALGDKVKRVLFVGVPVG